MSIYDQIKFPDYEFKEYPKWVSPAGGDPVLVAGPEEERSVLGLPEAKVEVPVSAKLKG